LQRRVGVGGGVCISYYSYLLSFYEKLAAKINKKNLFIIEMYIFLEKCGVYSYNTIV
jgi:hypothetical protein